MTIWGKYMEWEDTAIILCTANYSDTLVIVTAMTKMHGIRKGIVKSTKQTKALIYPGNIAQVLWRGRLEEHLGSFTVKSCEAIYPFIYNNRRKMLSLQSVCVLFATCLNEKERHEELYDSLEDFVYLIRFSERDWLKQVVILELHLLAMSGFGLDVSRCTVSGRKEDLLYLSPRTGKAVSGDVGEPYKNKLFTLPKIFIDYEYNPSSQEIAEALSITKHFLEKNILMLKRATLPMTRNMLQEALYAEETK